MKSLRWFATWLLMLALPLQGLAAYAPQQRCGDDAAAAAHLSRDGHAGHHDVAAADDVQHAAAGHQHPDDGPSADPAGHACCHHVVSGAVAYAMQGPLETPRAVTPRVSLLSTLFIPELPQRPPRA